MFHLGPQLYVDREMCARLTHLLPLCAESCCSLLLKCDNPNLSDQAWQGHIIAKENTKCYLDVRLHPNY